MTVLRTGIPQDHWRTHQVLDHYIHLSIVEEIANCQAARDPLFEQSWAGLITGVTERSILLVVMRKFGLTISAGGGKRINLRIHMAINGDEVEPAIIVEIDECIPPL